MVPQTCAQVYSVRYEPDARRASGTTSGSSKGISKPDGKTLQSIKNWGHITKPDLAISLSFFEALKEITKAKVSVKDLLAKSLDDKQSKIFKSMKFSKEASSAGKLLVAYNNDKFVDPHKLRSISKVMVYAKPQVMKELIPAEYLTLIVDSKSNRVFS